MSFKSFSTSKNVPAKPVVEVKPEVKHVTPQPALDADAPATKS